MKAVTRLARAWRLDAKGVYVVKAGRRLYEEPFSLRAEGHALPEKESHPSDGFDIQTQCSSRRRG